MILVTGITGHTGGFFLQELINNGCKETLRCVIRESSNTKALDNSGLNVEKVTGDLNNNKFIESIMEGVDTVVHIYNINHSPRIVKTASEHKVKRVIMVHTTGIYSKFKKASLGYKKIEEEINKQITSPKNTSPKLTILRPTMIYGDMCDSNMSKFIKMVDKLPIIPIIDKGESTLQPVNARDLGEALYKVLINPSVTSGKTYDISGEKPIKLLHVLKLIRKKLNQKTLFISLPLGLGVTIARISRGLTLGRLDYVEKVQRMGENRHYPHTKAKNDFGYKPISFEEGIQIEIKEYLEAKERE